MPGAGAGEGGEAGREEEVEEAPGKEQGDVKDE
jgi:hypothetical protein